MRLAVIALFGAFTILGLREELALAALELHLRADCTPDTVRTDSEAVFTCTTSVTNSGNAPATDITLIGGLAEVTLPSFELFDRAVDGTPEAVTSGQTTFDFPDVGPGETGEAVMGVIFGVREP